MKTLIGKIFRDLNLFNRFVVSINLAVVVLLLISYLSAYIPPSSSIMMAFLGLMYPFWLGLNILFVLYWIVLRKKQVFISIIAVILGLYPLSRFVQITFFGDLEENSESFKVMSFNVRVFDLYNWNGNIETKNQIISFLDQEQPDVICFQEYFRGEKIHFSVQDTLMDLLEMPHYFEHITVTAKEKKGDGKNYFGSAIFSRFPIINSGVQEFENDKSNHFIFVDIVKGKDTVRVFNAHLGSMRLQNADYKLIGGDDNKKWPSEKKSEQNLLQRMKDAFTRRERQVEILITEMESTSFPVILCTDLNDTPTSYAYGLISHQLTDAFVVSGNGIGSTYAGENVFNAILPVNRIDYIFYSEEFSSANFKTHQEKLSDHKAISCRFLLEEQ